MRKKAQKAKNKLSENVSKRRSLKIIDYNHILHLHQKRLIKNYFFIKLNLKICLKQELKNSVTSMHDSD
jgi:hypothetical protein